MFEKFNQIAERAATNTSRREFLGQLGRGAMTAAGAVAGYLAFGAEAQAGKRVCSTDSVWNCAGRAVGSPCGTPSRPGHCVGSPCNCAVK